MPGQRPRVRLYVFAVVVGAGMVGLTAPSARAEDVVPRVSPDRIEDVPSTRPDPFPAFNNFAWRAFISLNWPATRGERGVADRTRRLGDAGMRVWETYKARYEALPPSGAPSAWDRSAEADPCGAGGNARTIAAFKPFAEFNQASFTPGRFDPPLVASNRTYVRYEVRLNRREYEWIASGAALHPEAVPLRTPEGAISVKAAWRVLTPDDPPAMRARYYIARDVAVTDVAATLGAGRVVCETRDLALVGLHLVVRTRYRPQGIWASFEHVDDARDAGGSAEDKAWPGAAKVTYGFRPPDAADGGQAKRPPDEPVDLDHPPALDPDPTPLERRHQIRDEITQTNRAYQALDGVAGTVWANYRLVAIQWPTLPLPVSPDNDGRYFPGLRLDPGTPGEPYQIDDPGADRNLVNVTMESYEQDSPSSCMACHHAVANARGRDFVGILPDPVSPAPDSTRR